MEDEEDFVLVNMGASDETPTEDQSKDTGSKGEPSKEGDPKEESHYHERRPRRRGRGRGYGKHISGNRYNKHRHE